MDEVNLTSAVRQNLLALQKASQARELSARRLSTGKKVNDVVDNPSSYFQAKALDDRASGLREAKNDIDQAISAVEAATVGADAMNEIAKLMRGVALSARGGTDEQRQAASDRYDALSQQLDELAKDVSYNGVNLIKSGPDDLDVDVNEKGSSAIRVEGQDSSSNGLGIEASSSYNRFATDEDIDAAAQQLDEAVSTLRSHAANFGSNVALLSDRANFADRLSETLEEGAAKLVIADLNEEAARQISSQVRQQLATASLEIVADNGRTLTQLLS